MRKVISAMTMAALLAVAMVGSAFAAGGAPGVHGVDGRTFGGAVSGLAQSNPLGLADHTSGGRLPW